MQITTTLLNGEIVVVDVPDAALTAPVRTSVLSTGGLEIEVNAGAAEAADFYIASTGSSLTQEMSLRSGLRLRTGSLGGGTGTAFVVDVADEVVFGPAPPSMSVEDLAALLTATAPEMTPDGVALSPRGGVAWSNYRTHDLVIPVEVSGGQRYLLDVRAAFTLGEPAQQPVGRRVAGGLLSRSEESEGRHVILEAPDHVAYGIPLPGTDPDVLVQSMSGVRVSTG
ncbi:MAG: hypothetical protein ACR2FV_16580 [Ornithinimicrobium sp.]|uniref:hypothetical protein n=1 Tax=Ornithinimicrobium sp. TaxID=1977084 RepID=UPI00183FD446|nr:hypothetical protein [Actinomycetota bacterium]